MTAPTALSGIQTGASSLAKQLAQAVSSAAPQTAATTPLTAADPAEAGQLAPLEGGPIGPAFSDVLNGLLNQVNTAQQKSDQLVQQLALGEPVDVHQVMLSLSEASDAMQLLMTVRSKVLDAYQEVMRTQV